MENKPWLALPLIAALLLLGISTPTRAGTHTLQAAGTPTPSLAATFPPTDTASPTLSPTKIITATATITPTVSATPSVTPSPTTTQTPTLTPSPSPSETPTITATPTPTLTPAATLPDNDGYTNNTTADGSTIFLPIILNPEPPPFVPPVKELFCSNLSSSLAIPDNNPNGLSHTLHIADPRTITDLDVYLKINHTYVGDLKAVLTHQETGKTVNLFDRPGYPGSSYGCARDDIRAIIDDEMTWHVESKCASYPAAISGSYEPVDQLSTFDEESIQGDWTLTISDHAASHTGSLREWCLVGKISENPPPPTPTPPPPSFPSQAIISGVHGQHQSLPLDCESRSAVDWANYFGYHINELDFFYRLPHSDNPDRGFVGPVTGGWGQIPPNPYGVHAEPVAEGLGDYGLPAVAHRPLSWNELRAEIAAGRPVIVWIIGSISLPGSLMNGAPVYYTPTDGLHTVVARYEHTVVVTGYDSSNVYYLNGSTIYKINSDKFLDSWSALGNMAITWQP